MSAKIYHIPLPPPEDRNEAIDYLNIIVQRTQNYLYKMEGMAQANAVLARKNSSRHDGVKRYHPSEKWQHPNRA